MKPLLTPYWNARGSIHAACSIRAVPPGSITTAISAFGSTPGAPGSPRFPPGRASRPITMRLRRHSSGATRSRR